MLFCTTYLQFCSRTFFVIFEYFCHPHPLFVLSTVPSCKDIQIPHDFRVEINDVSTRLFLKQTLSHSSSVLKLTFIDGPPWQNNFGDGALNQYKGVSSRDKSVSSRYKSVFTRTPGLDTFGFWLFFKCPNHSQMVRKVANRGLTTHPNHVNPLCFQLISCGITVTCNRFVGFLSSWLFLIIWSKNVFGRQQRFFTATTKISAVSGKNQKKEHQEGIGMSPLQSTCLSH